MCACVALILTSLFTVATMATPDSEAAQQCFGYLIHWDGLTCCSNISETQLKCSSFIVFYSDIFNVDL